MGPYTKNQYRSCPIDDGWTVRDGTGAVIAHVDTESMANVLLAYVTDHPCVKNVRVPEFPVGTPIGEDETEDETGEDA